MKKNKLLVGRMKRFKALFITLVMVTFSCQMVAAQEIGDEGCTTGFWENHSILKGSNDCWCEGYAVDTLLTDIFDADNLTAISPNPRGRKQKNAPGFVGETMNDALMFRGGGSVEGAVRNLLRQSASALLNACSANVDFAYTETEIITMVDDALASQDIETITGVKNDLANANESNLNKCIDGTCAMDELVDCEVDDEGEDTCDEMNNCPIDGKCRIKCATDEDCEDGEVCEDEVCEEEEEE